MEQFFFAAALLLITAILLLGAYILCRIFPVPPVRNAEAYLILPVSGHMEDIEFRIRKALSCRSRLGGTVICIVDFGADAETRGIVQRMCREEETIRYIREASLTGMLREGMPLNANQK